jgi:ferritin-like metal-binding protein YciE
MTSRESELRSIFVIGLKNAHAMENQALSILRPQASRIESYPAVLERLKSHINETEAQEARLEELLASMDASPSTLKDTALSIGGSLAAVGHSMAGDEILKNSFANFAFENYEIAAYSSLLTLAEAGGYRQAETVLKQNLREEEAMARWLSDNLASVTRQFANLREAGETAKI